MKYIALAILGFTQLNVFAQNQSSFPSNKWAITGSIGITKNTIYENSFHPYYFSPALGLIKKSNKGFKELEINDLKFISNQKVNFNGANTNAEYYIKQLNISLKSSMFRRLVTSKQGNSFLLGAVFNPYLYNNSNTAVSSYFYSSSTLHTGLSIGISPRFIHPINDRLFTDIKMEFNVVNFGLTRDYIDNPMLEIQQRSLTVLDFNTYLIPKFSTFKIGIGYQI